MTLEEVINIANDNDLWILEDNCDTLGSKYSSKFTGTFGHQHLVSIQHII
ncbi:MAG: DegT/DnrJ/EryC1/StrS family aminotransferase [Methanobacteriaceae archaeon]|nr:DegT/DnrJ/EryC1/StrS family aminotransferase [Methanobacteriaceae archaeon]MDP3622397.1 DegT/DnrJ/EryC1/StrS family aminotransferase [Methanobacteriaceae archaeon]